MNALCNLNINSINPMNKRIHWYCCSLFTYHMQFVEIKKINRSGREENKEAKITTQAAKTNQLKNDKRLTKDEIETGMSSSNQWQTERNAEMKATKSVRVCTENVGSKTERPRNSSCECIHKK